MVFRYQRTVFRPGLAAVLLCSLLAGVASAQVVVDEQVFSVTSRVIEVTPEGIIRSLDDVEVWIVASATRPTPHGPQTQGVGRWKTTTRTNGMALFPEIRRLEKASYQLVTSFQGISYRSEAFRASGAPPRELRVYHAAPAPSASVNLRSHWTLDVGEAYLRVAQIVRVMNDSLVTVDYVHAAQGLRMPTLTHVLMDGSLVTRGLFPTGKTHGASPPSTGQGQLVGEQGALVYRGPVPPGSGLFFQFSYNIPFEHEDVLLGAVSDLDLNDAAITVRWTDKTTARARVLNPHRAVRGAREGAIRTDMLIRGPLRAGDPVRLRIERLPVQTRLPMWTAAAGGLAGLSLFLLLLTGAIWRRRMATT